VNTSSAACLELLEFTAIVKYKRSCSHVHHVRSSRTWSLVEWTWSEQQQLFVCFFVMRVRTLNWYGEANGSEIQQVLLKRIEIEHYCITTRLCTRNQQGVFITQFSSIQVLPKSHWPCNPCRFNQDLLIFGIEQEIRSNQPCIQPISTTKNHQNGMTWAKA